MLSLLLLLACASGNSELKSQASELGCEEQLAGYEGRFSGDALLSMREVFGLPLDHVSLTRNEIFARHGRGFHAAEVREHFQATSWYCERPNFDESVLSRNERSNVELLLSLEGDHSFELQEIGRFLTPEGGHLLIQDAQVLEIYPSGGPSYGPREVYWVSRGDWLVTWSGPAHFSLYGDGVESPQAWRLSPDKGRVLQVVDLRATR